MTGLIITFCLIVYVLMVFGRKITPSMKNRIMNEGLYHITSVQNAEKIMNGDVATIKPSNRFKSYCNFFRRSSFFFCGKPSKENILFNISKTKKIVAIYISPENITEDMIKKMKYRWFDASVIYPGEFSAVAEVVEFNFNELPTKEPLMHIVLYSVILLMVVSAIYQAFA